MICEGNATWLIPLCLLCIFAYILMGTVTLSVWHRFDIFGSKPYSRDMTEDEKHASVVIFIFWPMVIFIGILVFIFIIVPVKIYSFITGRDVNV